MSTEPAPTPTIPKPHRRRWLGALIVFVAIGLGALGGFGYLSWVAENDWKSAEAETDLLDPHWRLAEIEAKVAPIADADNSALQVIRAHAKSPRFQVSAAANYTEICAKQLSAPAQLNQQQAELLETQLKKIPAALTEARKLKDMPAGRFVVRVSDDFFSTLLPDHQDVRTVADWLRHDAYLLAHEKKGDAALDDCRAILNAGRAAGDDRFLITHLIRLSLQGVAVETTERVLSQTQVSEENLLELQTLVEREIAQSNWMNAIRGERAGNHHLFDNVRSGKIPSSVLRVTASGRQANSFSGWAVGLFPRTVLREYPDHLRAMNRLVEITRLPLHQQKEKLRVLEADLQKSGSMLASALLPAFARIQDAESRSQGSLRSMLAALACERYRLTHDNRWPMSLDELVTEKLLSTVPLDPVDGKPLRYRREADRVVIYSLGMDAKDDNGHIDRGMPGDVGVDVGFRLWSPEKRRGPAPPPVVLPAAPPR